MRSFGALLASLVAVAVMLAGSVADERAADPALTGAVTTQQSVAAATRSVTRLGGATRFATARRIAEHHMPVADRVYLTTGDDYPDALVAGAIAGGHNAPVLLARHETLPGETREALQRLSPAEVIVVGGTAAVSDGVAQNAATAADASLRRVAGANRLETAIRMADEAAAGPNPSIAYLATADGFVDALTASAAAAADGAPLLLTPGEGPLASPLGDAVEALGLAELKVIGGTASIPDRVLTELDSRTEGDVVRVAGSDRFATAVAVARQRFDGNETAYLATAFDFPDALAGGAMAGASHAPLLLSGRETLPGVVGAELERSQVSTLVALGGESTLANSVLSQAERMLRGGDDDEAAEDGSDPGERSDKPAEDPDRVLSGEESFAGFTVPAGEVWAFDPQADTTVEATENVVVRGTLRMRPASAEVTHTLRFVGVDETQFQGGGMEVLASDVGLWVVDDGQLDLQGTPRAGWNRTGDDPSWRDGDEVRRAPIHREVTDEFPRFTPGHAVPSVTAPNGSEHPTEVFNLTRNVRIHGGGSNPADESLSDDGRAHVICLVCNQPQTIKHVELRWLGPREGSGDSTEGVLGRYPLHFHHGGDGTQGTTVEGTVVRDSGNQAYVPHAANGITFHDTISFDTLENAYTWDTGDDTHELVYDHAAAFLTRDHPRHRANALKGFKLASGTNLTIRDSVVAGNQGKAKANAGGFQWPSKMGGENTTWTFENNVAHNNRGNGLGVWQNNANDHVVTDFVSFHNTNGIQHGAYLNRYDYRDGLVFGNQIGIKQDALGGSSDNQLRFDRLDVGSVRIDQHNLDSSAPAIYRNTRVRDGVVVDEDANDGSGIIEFRYDCDHTHIMLTPDDFDLVAPRSHISIVDECSDRTTAVHNS